MDHFIAGADEVGRGAFAGPVVAACVVFPDTFCAEDVPDGIRIYDSKKLTALQREKASLWIQRNAVAWAVGEGSVQMINEEGIVPATYFAFRSSVQSTLSKGEVNVEKLLVDGYKIPRVNHFSDDQQEAIVKGDQLSIHISAASIVAKVYRDSLMEKLSISEKHTPYAWNINKGYGTKQHREAIQMYGITDHHRKLFCRNAIENRNK